MAYNTREELVDAIFESILELLVKHFPEPIFVDAKQIADRCGITYTITEGKLGYGDKVEYDAIVTDDFDRLVRSVRTWLSESEYVISNDSQFSTLTTLSERGAVLMNRLPQVLAKAMGSH